MISHRVKNNLKVSMISLSIVLLGSLTYKAFTHNPEILISCTNEETFIYTPKEKKLLFVRIGNLIYNKKMLATKIDGVVYAQMGSDDLGRASFTYDTNSNKLNTNFDKLGEVVGIKEAECKTKKLN